MKEGIIGVALLAEGTTQGEGPLRGLNKKTLEN